MMPTTIDSEAEPAALLFPTPSSARGERTSVSKTASSKVKIVNRYGLHARPATDFAQAANGFASDIRVRNEGEEADGKSVMELMMLAATKGTELELICVGDDAKDALNHLAALIHRGFDEEED